MAILLVLTVGDETRRHPIAQGETFVGSASGCDIRVGHFSISRRHARLSHGRDGLQIEDLDSKNGTSVDGHPLIGISAITSGQRLTFGDVSAVVEEVADDEVESGVEPPPQPPTLHDQSPGPDSSPTLAAGSLKIFALERMPDLVCRAADGETSASLARQVGAALFDTLPCAEVEVVTTVGMDLGVVFHAGCRSNDLQPLEIVTSDPDLVFRVGFRHPTERDACAPLVRSAVSLVGLAPARAGGLPRSSTRRLPPPLPDPCTVDPEVKRIYLEAVRIARGSVGVVISGESGVGKEVLAKYIHSASSAPDKSFVALNCAALPRDLLEAELFGIERGVATGVEARPGKFELADGGTLFLDEIGDMAGETQAKILRVLQEREVFRLGAHGSRPARVRVVAATNQDLDARVADGTFRRDLYHRIADWVVHLPPLRRRSRDIPNLAAHFLAQACAELGIRSGGISRGAIATLMAFNWPGNIRQLEREMARAALFLEHDELLDSSRLQPAIREHSSAAKGEKKLSELLASTESREIRRVLELYDDDHRAAAEHLGLSRSTFYRRLKELGLRAP